jgi:SAM-dependent methyltransferase
VTNVTFEAGDLMTERSGRYDIILCLGVLHHTASMERVLRHLQSCLRGDGYLYLWVYGRHGRYRHTLNRRLLGMLAGPGMHPENKLALAHELAAGGVECRALEDLADPYGSDAALRGMLDDPVWLADQFLSPHEELVDMEELLKLIAAGCLELKQWLGVRRDRASYFASPALRERFEALDSWEQMLALDMLLKPARYFVLLGKRDAAVE